MNKDTQERSNTEEVDLGQLFKLIGNAFNRFFRFIGSILNGLFLGFVWVVFFIKKNAVKILIAAILGVGFGFYKEKIAKPIYRSSAIVKQNYNTGKNLYELIGYYNKLINEKDTVTLKNNLNISPLLATSIKSIQIKPNIVETQMMKNYDNYIKSLDSTFASTIDYKTYFDNINPYEFMEQQLSVNVEKKINANPIFENIVKNINNTDYFKRENEKDINQLNNRDAALKQILTKADSLQNMYKRVLEMQADKTSTGAQTSVTIEGSDQIDKTKEFELYKSEIDIRRELVLIQREREDREVILEIVSNKQDIAIADNRIEIFNIQIAQKIFYGLAFAFIVILVLLSLEFLKYLERFRNQI
jgi:hypothetical protein